jgi:hypothetical protein
MTDGGKRLARGSKRKGTRGFAYFAIQKRYGKLLPGIYQRFSFSFGSAVKPVMIFVHSTNYKRRLDFFNLAERVSIREFNQQFPIMLNEAIRTAR